MSEITPERPELTDLLERAADVIEQFAKWEALESVGSYRLWRLVGELRAAVDVQVSDPIDVAIDKALGHAGGSCGHRRSAGRSRAWRPGGPGGPARRCIRRPAGSGISPGQSLVSADLNRCGRCADYNIGGLFLYCDRLAPALGAPRRRGGVPSCTGSDESGQLHFRRRSRHERLVCVHRAPSEREPGHQPDGRASRTDLPPGCRRRESRRAHLDPPCPERALA